MPLRTCRFSRPVRSTAPPPFLLKNAASGAARILHVLSSAWCYYPQRAPELIREYSLRVVACDIEREALPFNDHSFATITLCATFEHLRVDPLFALEEMRRVLQPGGLLYLTTPNLYRLGNIASFALGRGLAFDPIREYGKLRSVGHMGHVREYTASEIRRFLEGAGFATVRILSERNRPCGPEPSARARGRPRSDDGRAGSAGRR